MATPDLLLHPVRMRILQALFDADPLTTAQLRDRLPDIAPATMYRHVAVLADGGVLEVVEREAGARHGGAQLPGAQEQTLVNPAARAAMTHEDHRQAFTMFAASLMADFDRYLAHDDADPVADGVVYRQAVVWLTEDEFAEMIEESPVAIIARIGNAQRRRRYPSPPQPRRDTGQNDARYALIQLRDGRSRCWTPRFLSTICPLSGQRPALFVNIPPTRIFT